MVFEAERLENSAALTIRTSDSWVNVPKLSSIRSNRLFVQVYAVALMTGAMAPPDEEKTA